MATVGYKFAEVYVMQKMNREKMKKIEKEDVKKIDTIKTGSMDKKSSGCFSWLSKRQHKKISRISDSNDQEAQVIVNS